MTETDLNILYNEFDLLIDKCEENHLPEVAQQLRDIRDEIIPSERVAVIDIFGSGKVYELNGEESEALSIQEIQKQGRVVMSFDTHRSEEE